MVTRLLYIFLFMHVCLCATAQKYNAKDFPQENYTVLKDTFRLQKIRIEHVRVRPKSPQFYAANCRTFLSVFKKDSLIQEYYFPTFNPSNGCFGIYIPDKQSINGWFVMQQMDEDNDKLYLIDTLGKIFILKGVSFCHLKGTSYIFGFTHNNTPITNGFNLNTKTILADVIAGDDFFEWYYSGKEFFCNYSIEKNGDLQEKVAVVPDTENRILVYPGARIRNQKQILLPEFPEKNQGNCLCK